MGSFGAFADHFTGLRQEYDELVFPYAYVVRLRSTPNKSNSSRSLFIYFQRGLLHQAFRIV